MTRKPQTIDCWVGRLPHWEVEDGRYFVTIHLAGAIPKQGQQRIREIADSHNRHPNVGSSERLRHSRMIFREMEAWLDRASQRTDLQIPDVSNIVQEAIEHRSNSGIWNMYEWVIMPNHIHMFFELISGRLKPVLESFKQRTGRVALSILDTPEQRFWQREWFDHWSRSDEEDARIMRYIRENPVKANLCKRPADWQYSSAQ